MIAYAVRYHLYARQVMALAAIVCFVSVICYGAFLLVAVERAAAQQSYESNARDLSQSLAMLETQYLTESNALTPDKAKQLGLTPISSSRIAYQTVALQKLTLR